MGALLTHSLAFAVAGGVARLASAYLVESRIEILVLAGVAIGAEVVRAHRRRRRISIAFIVATAGAGAVGIIAAKLFLEPETIRAATKWLKIG